MSQIIQFNVQKESTGGYYATAIGHAIITQADTFEELTKNIREATELYFDEESSEMKNLPVLINFEIPEYVA